MIDAPGTINTSAIFMMLILFISLMYTINLLILQVLHTQEWYLYGLYEDIVRDCVDG